MVHEWKKQVHSPTQAVTGTTTARLWAHLQPRFYEKAYNLTDNSYNLLFPLNGSSFGKILPLLTRLSFHVALQL